MIEGGTNEQTEVRKQIEDADAEYGRVILRFATRLCDNRDDAEDIVVETSLAIWNCG